MVYKVVIKDNEKAPLQYLSDLDNFQNGMEYVFKPGVNLIVGENGCGKTTLMKLIQRYLLVGQQQCEEKNVVKLFENYKLKDEEMTDGVDVYADYTTNIFRLAHPEEYKGESGIGLQSFENFGALGTMMQSSTGEGVTTAINNLWNLMFSGKASLSFPKLSGWRKERYAAYIDYVKKHRIKPTEEEKEITILMDEPDRNLSLDNIEHIRSILSFHKPQTQLIAVIHNPLLIYNLSKVEDINIIEMTEGYVHKVKSIIRTLVK
jgi:ABC-type cobalamin/Fe3+-siderophores transport system ATPase subunit